MAFKAFKGKFKEKLGKKAEEAPPSQTISQHATLQKRSDGPSATAVPQETAPMTNEHSGTAPENPTRAKATANPAFEIALAKHVESLGETDKQRFREASLSITEENVLSSVKAFDERHKQASRTRQHSESISRFLGAVDKSLAGVAIGVQTHIEASVIVGAVRLVIGIGVKFLEFFGKLALMMDRFVDFLEPMANYVQACKERSDLLEALASIYGDLLTFCRQARSVFVDEKGQERRWTSFRVFWRLQWVPFEEDFGSIESNMQHHLNVVQHFTQGTILNSTLDLSRSDIERKERERIYERESFLTWVSTIPFEKIHEDTFAKKYPGTGDWLIRKQEFQDWFDSSTSSLFWCYGKPGIGKSVLTSNVLEYISRQRALDNRVGICFVYYDYKREETLSDASEIIRALIKQLCRKTDKIPPAFLKIKQDALDASQLGNLESFATTVHDLNDEVFLILDALDECPKDSRPKILEFLARVLKTLPRAKIFVTSRRESDIERAFQTLNTPTFEIEARNIAADIELYVRSETKRLREGDHGEKLFVEKESLAEDIINTLIEKSEGMFLWVNLQLSNLCKASELEQDDEVERALKELPPDLEKTYAQMWKRIQNQRESVRRLALSTLRLVFYARRPLRTTELQHALAIKESSKTIELTSLDKVSVILASCANLLLEERHTAEGGAFTVVRPIHYTVQEFFTDPDGNNDSDISLREIRDPLKSHAHLSVVCMAYLQSTLQDLLPCREGFELFRRDRELPLAWYAAQFFDTHLSCASPLSEDVVQLTWSFIRRPTEFLAVIQQLRSMQHAVAAVEIPDPEIDFDSVNWTVDTSTIVFATRLHTIPGFDKDLQLPQFALHRACAGGFKDLAIRLLNERFEVNEKDDQGLTPLYYTASRGDLSLTKALLEKKAATNVKGGEFGTPLQVASYRHHENIVKLLLDWKADPNAPDGYFGSALTAAAASGDNNIIGILLSQGARIDPRPGHTGYSIQTAVQWDQLLTVEFLLDQGADIEAHAGDQGNALQIACMNGNYALVELLLDRHADVNAQTGHLGNALQVAAFDGNNEIVELLLRNGANVNAFGGEYDTALHAAAYQGQETTVDLLLRNGADVTTWSYLYGSALGLAERRGQHKVAELLLAKITEMNNEGAEYDIDEAYQAPIGSRAPRPAYPDRPPRQR